MTTKTIEERRKEHLKTYNNPDLREYNYKIYNAMRKHGVQNFRFEVVERCSDLELSEREKYYIKLYNACTNGYNESIGGAGKCFLSNKQIEACRILYDYGWVLQDIAEVFKSNSKTIGKKLRDYYDIDTKRNANKRFSKKVFAKNKDEYLEFESVSSAARYLIDNNLTDNKSYASVISKISEAAKIKKRSAYGFNWEYDN